MPPPLALLLCTAFVLFLLWLEWRASRGVSAAMWIPTLWMLMISSKSLDIWFGVIALDNESGSMLERLALTALGVAGLVVLARRRFDWSGALRRHGWLLALLAFMFVSTFWSDITILALRRWVRELVVVVMALVIISEASPLQALASLLRRSAYVLIPFSLMLIKYYPLLGRQYARWSGIQMWTGVTYQKNSLGRLCMISAFFLLWELYQRWRERRLVRGRYQALADVSVICIALYLLRGADSATSLAAIIVASATFLGFCWLRKLKIMVSQVVLLALVIFLIAFGVSLPFLGGASLSTITSSLNRDETLTGRTEVWAAILPEMKQQPLLGHGFGSFWTTARRDFYQIGHGHNGYLDILLDLGAVGLIMYIVWLLSCTRKLHRALRQDYDWASLAICFLLMALICNASESILSSLTEQITAVFTLASVVIPYKPSGISGRI